MAASLLTIILVFFIIIVLLILFSLTFIPVRATFTVFFRDKTDLSATVQWGIISIQGMKDEVEFRLFGHAVFRKKTGGEEPETEEMTEEETNGRDVSSGVKAGLSVWDENGRRVKAILRTISAERVACDLRLGLGDPALTGRVYGYFWALKGIALATGRADLRMEPLFEETRFEGTAEGTLAIRHPIALIIPAIRIIISPSVRAFRKEEEKT